MNLRDVLEKYKSGDLSLNDAQKQIQLSNFSTLSDIANIDHTRQERTGIPEVVLAEGKYDNDLVAIVNHCLSVNKRVVVTRLEASRYSKSGLSEIESQVHEWDERSRVLVLGNKDVKKTGGIIGVISAGTADIAVANEAAIIAREMGCEIITAYDVGVAGIHRLFPYLTKMMGAGISAIVVAAGREGTLPSIVAGLVDVPVIGVPVSTGYGIGGKGEAALYSMLQSCSVLSVVNIDAGFVAGAFAAQIANNCAKARGRGIDQDASERKDNS